MEIISSQPFLIVFYRKARFPLPLQRKSSLPQSLPRQERPFPAKEESPFPISPSPISFPETPGSEDR